MSEFKRQYFAAAPAVIRGQADRTIGDVDGRHVYGLRYSSPWPWMLALVVSLTIWGLLVRSIWHSFT
jgi:hypothetical protein